ncbi:hypothetical protein [Pedobacter sp. UBA5917]|jgi:hypothetical protein|uniref:hypothetical protein n=1 Tax=Pedobacter sp. UBA5917 TaxID=1947061 RepID=UPI0025DF42A5|nr:hypothetical protein [Pedobacter sp. UBA5917]
MGTIRYIAKNITETAESSKWIASNGDIAFNTTKEIIQQSKNNIQYNQYKPIVTSEAEDFDITFSLNKNETTVVPLGILNFNNGYENPYFAFDYALTVHDIDALEFQIKDADENVIYQLNNLAPVVVTASKVPQIKNEAKELLPAYPSKTPDFKTILEQFSLSPADYTKIGSYVLYWDGFDNNEVYDSTRFNNKKLTAKITAIKAGKRKSLKVNFSTHYEQVDWVDVKINRKNNRIDTILRVNLKDGGAEGLDCWKNTRDFNQLHNKSQICDWDKIPESEIKSDQPILKTRTKTFEELEKLAIAGINYHWGRNKNHFIAHDIKINGKLFAFFMNAKNSEENSIGEVNLIYNTNGDWMRSGNPGSIKDPMTAVGNIISRQAICYNVGYINYSNGWGYSPETSEDQVFKDTSAHEIGHEILKKYGGTIYSYGHKGSVNSIF